MRQNSSASEHLFTQSTLRTKQLRRFRNKIALAFSHFHFRSARTLFHFPRCGGDGTKRTGKKKRIAPDTRLFPLFLRSDFSSLGLIFFLSVLLGLLGLLLLLIGGGDGGLFLLLLLGLQSERNNSNVWETVSFAR